MRALGRRIAHAAATAVKTLGVDARARSGSEIEIDGRTVGVLGAAGEGDALLFQGLLYFDVDPARLVRLARMAALCAGEHAVREARARLCGLKDVLRRPETAVARSYLGEAFESEFDIEFSEGELTLTEHARFERARSEIETADWVALVPGEASSMPLRDATHAFPGGRLRAVIKYETSARTIREVWFSGGVGLEPARLALDLEAALRDTPMDLLSRRVEWFFGSRPARCNLAQPSDFIAAVRLAVGQPLAASS
jgi:hypothetical protein